MKLKYYSSIVILTISILFNLVTLPQVYANPVATNSNTLAQLIQSIETDNLALFNQQLSQIKQPKILNETYMGQTPLYKAAKLGRLEMLKQLLKKQVDIDKPADSSITPLMSAAYNGHLSVLDELIKQGANLLIEQVGGYQAFDWALESNQTEILISLLKALSRSSDPLAQAWMNYAFAEQSESPQDLPDAKTQSFALIAAVLNNNQKLLTKLIQVGFNPDFHNVTGYAALPLAVRLDRLDMVEQLIKSGADINLGNNGDDEASAINQAARAANLAMLQRIVAAGADVNKQNAKGFSALHLASYKGSIECVKYLLSQKANIQLKTIDGFTAFDYAYQSADKAILIELLLSDLDEMSRKMVINGLNDGKMPEKDELSQHHGVISAAIIAGVDFKLLKAQLLNSQQINQPVMGYYPLNYAARFAHLELVKALVKHGAAVNQRALTGYQTSPLMDAARENGNLAIAEYLIAHKAEIKQGDKNGDPVINWATYYGHYDLVSRLLQQGADPLQANKDNYTALKTAKEQGFDKIVELIQSYLK